MSYKRSNRRTGSRPRRSGSVRAHRGDLTLVGVVDGLAEHARGFLRRMEAHAVLGGDEIEPPLRVALELARGGELVVGRAPRLRRADRVEQPDQRLAAALEEIVVALLD